MRKWVRAVLRFITDSLEALAQDDKADRLRRAEHEHRVAQKRHLDYLSPRPP